MRSAFSLFFHRYGAPDADAELIRILVEMRMKGTLELLKGEYSMEHVLRLTQQTGIYADGGFRSLIAFLQKNSKAKARAITPELFITKHNSFIIGRTHMDQRKQTMGTGSPWPS